MQTFDLMNWLSLFQIVGQSRLGNCSNSSHIRSQTLPLLNVCLTDLLGGTKNGSLQFVILDKFSPASSSLRPRCVLLPGCSASTTLNNAVFSTKNKGNEIFFLAAHCFDHTFCLQERERSCTVHRWFQYFRCCCLCCTHRLSPLCILPSYLNLQGGVFLQFQSLLPSAKESHPPP